MRAAIIYSLLHKDPSSFDPEAIQTMSEAYEETCELVLGLHYKKDDPITQRVARRIIETARTGERDVGNLRDEALRAIGVEWVQ